MRGLPGRNYAVRRVRALAMIAERMKGETLVAIASRHNCTDTTVSREIDWAAKEGLLQKFEDQIASELAPLAIAAYKKALENNDTIVAKDVLSGLGILKKPREAPKPQSEREEMDLELYISKREGKVNVIGRGKSAGAIAATAEKRVLEGVVVEAPPSLPAGTPQDMGERDFEDSYQGIQGYLDPSTDSGGEEDE